jgi:hypothetical protein
VINQNYFSGESISGISMLVHSSSGNYNWVISAVECPRNRCSTEITSCSRVRQTTLGVDQWQRHRNTNPRCNTVFACFAYHHILIPINFHVVNPQAMNVTSVLHHVEAQFHRRLNRGFGSSINCFVCG